MSHNPRRDRERVAAVAKRYNALPINVRRSRSAAARALGISVNTLKYQLETFGPANSITFNEPTADINVEADQQTLLDRIGELEKQVRAAKDRTLDDEYVQRKIIGLQENLAAVKPPEWALRPIKGDGLPGVPAMIWSDWHWGERVFPTQINGVNEFDLAIANKRARKLVETAVHLLRHHVVNPTYPGIVVCLGGDMVTGDIHEELSESNELPIMPTVVDLYGALLWAIRALADEFGHVFLPCVTGNHGRNTRKPRAKNRNFTNFDWLLYSFLAKAFAADDRVQFYIPDGPDALFRIYGHRYLLTHGDQFRGGDGQIGAIGPITRGNKRKLARNSQIDLDYDTMLLGHWHQYMPLHRSIVNGSLKGYDEYANANNFEFEPPIQALWMTHHRKGIIHHMPIYLEDTKPRAAASDWITWKEAA